MLTLRNDIIPSFRDYKRTMALTFSGWMLCLAYLLYDYVIYKNLILEHLLSPPHPYEMFFHILLIAFVPGIFMFAGYQDCKRTKLVTELKEITEKWKKTYDAIPDLIFILNRDYRIIDANKAALDRWGSGIIGKHCYVYVHNTDVPIDACPNKRCIETGMIIREEIEEPPLSGCFYEVTCSPIVWGDGKVIGSVHVIKDMTEKKRAERERQNLEAQLYQAQKMESIGRFAGGIAHDFNNLLTAIIGFAGVLQTQIRGDDPTKIYLNQIQSAAEKAAILTSSILTFSRIKVINTKPTNTNEIINNIEQLLVRIIGEDIKLKAVLSPEELTVNADESQIEQVLMNLATNARDAMPDGGSLIIETGTADLDEGYAAAHINIKPGRYAIVSVTDTGIGMDEDTKNRIFEPFFTTKETGKGTGLGMAVVYGIVNQHDGHINVYSEKGVGTTFRIYLPLINKGNLDSDKPVYACIEILRGFETILVAEDSPDVGEILTKVLSDNGYKVILAKDGADAVEKFKCNKDEIQLFLSDIVMPAMNGMEALNEIRKIKPDIKSLFISGYPDNIIHNRGMLEPNLKIISKPFKPNELLMTLKDVLRPENGRNI